MISWELQKVIYSTLTSTTAITSLVKGIYDAVPQELAEKAAPDEKYFPFIVIGDDLVRPWDTDTTTGFEVFTTINIWSRYNGTKNIKQIAAAINQVLHRSTLTVPGYNSVYGHLEQFQIIKDADGLTQRGIAEFKFISMKN